jgi:hypothetical protein
MEIHKVVRVIFPLMRSGITRLSERRVVVFSAFSASLRKP